MTSSVRAGWDPPCVLCGRRRAEHARVQIGEEVVTPACEILHRGGVYPEGPPAPPRSLEDRTRVARQMPLQQARAIAGSLGAPSKMPGAAYGLDAFQCKVGSELAGDPTSVCHGCYARKNFYRYWWPAMRARHHRQKAILHEYWVEAMIVLLWDYLDQGGEPSFRWHDSGDLQSVDHLEKICHVAEATSAIRQWLPTREYGFVAAYLEEGHTIPENLCVRLSAHYIDQLPNLPAVLRSLPTSTVHTGPVPVVREKGAIGCRAIIARDNICGRCRACWDQRVKNVSYPMH